MTLREAVGDAYGPSTCRPSGGDVVRYSVIVFGVVLVL